MPDTVLIGLGLMAVLLGGSIWWFNRKDPPTSAHTLVYKAQSEQQLHEQFQTISLWMAEAEGAQARQRVVEMVALNYPWFKPAAEVLQHIFHGLERAEHVSDFHDRIKLTESIHTYQAAMFDALPFKVDVATRATQGNALNTLLQECWSGKKVPPPSPAPAVAPIPTPRPTPMPAPEIAPPARHAPVQNWAVTVNRGAAELDRLVAMGDWDSARDALQHVAYGMVDADEQTKRAFTQAMCQFAARDPLYHEVMGLVTTLVGQSPGILQSKLYPHFPDLSPEMVRYVLYYAAELGDVVRRKKGNSYALFPKGTEPVLVEKPPKKVRVRPPTAYKGSVESRLQRDEHWAHRYPQMLASSTIFSYWQFRTVSDGRDPPDCQQLNGRIERFDSPFWEAHNPAKCRRLECRCTIRIYRAKDLTPDKSAPLPREA